MTLFSCAANNPNQDGSDASRFVPLQGTYNTRDFGGYPAAGGKRVRYGMLYRSDDLSQLTGRDLTTLGALGLKTVIDFRTDKVQELTPDRLPKDLALFQPLGIKVGNVYDEKLGALEDGPEFMRETNRTLVSGPQKQYQEFFKIISSGENLPALFHCSAGKDRTGLGAALFLSALGVDRETIYRDYLLSAENLKGKYDELLEKNPAMKALITVRRDYLEAAFEEIESRFGSVDNYLSTYLNVDPERLRAIYLE